MCNFRNLKADEIDVRISQITNKGFSLLLYKDARCDMNILDETVGAKNWQRQHTRDNANCIVSIWDDDKKQWVSKEDTGTESNTEKEKGLASDSFKRACFNWGIGRELYTSPFIWVSDTSYIKTNEKTSKSAVYEKFRVSEIEISDKKIILELEIVDSKGNIVFSTNKVKSIDKPKIPMITDKQIETIAKLKIKEEDLCIYFKIENIRQMTFEQANQVIKMKMKKIKKEQK